jgi:hypothetical protein
VVRKIDFRTCSAKLLKGEDSYLKESTGIEIYNPRTRLVFEAFRRGLLTGEELEAQNKDYKVGCLANMVTSHNGF